MARCPRRASLLQNACALLPTSLNAAVERDADLREIPAQSVPRASLDLAHTTIRSHRSEVRTPFAEAPTVMWEMAGEDRPMPPADALGIDASRGAPECPPCISQHAGESSPRARQVCSGERPRAWKNRDSSRSRKRPVGCTHRGCQRHRTLGQITATHARGYASSRPQTTVMGDTGLEGGPGGVVACCEACRRL
jgi:hypothetical protein